MYTQPAEGHRGAGWKELHRGLDAPVHDHLRHGSITDKKFAEE